MKNTELISSLNEYFRACGTLSYDGHQLSLVASMYSNKRVCLQLFFAEDAYDSSQFRFARAGDTYRTITLNAPDVMIAEDQFIIDSYSDVGLFEAVMYHYDLTMVSDKDYDVGGEKFGRLASVSEVE